MEYINILLGLFGGLALFLFGMEFMGDGLENAAGSRLKSFYLIYLLCNSHKDLKESIKKICM